MCHSDVTDEVDFGGDVDRVVRTMAASASCAVKPPCDSCEGAAAAAGGSCCLCSDWLDDTTAAAHGGCCETEGEGGVMGSWTVAADGRINRLMRWWWCESGASRV